MSFSSNKVRPSNIDLNSSQTIGNKVLDASNDFSGDIIDPARSDVKKGTQAELETYALSATNGQLCFATDTKLMYQVLDSALVSVGSGSSAINYIANPDLNIDVSDITGDTNLVISQETVAPLRGAGSLKIAKGAIDASTQSVVIDMNSVDAADLAQMMTISFDIDASNINYNDGDAQVRIIKDPAGSPTTIRVNGEDIKGGKHTHIAQFQTDHTEVDYALEIYWADTGVLASELILDNIQVGPREVVKGQLVQTQSLLMESGSSATAGTVTNFTTTLNKGVSLLSYSAGIFTSNYDNVTVTTSASGSINTADSRVTIFFQIDGVNYRAAQDSLNSGTGYMSSATGTTILNKGDTAFIQIEGQGDSNNVTATVSATYVSSNAVSSEDLGGREIVVRGKGNSSTVITASTTDIDFTETRDTSSSWNGSQFTAPESGDYSLVGMVYTTAATDTQLRAYIDGALESIIGNSASIFRPFSDIVKLEKGQVLSLRLDNNLTLANNSAIHHIHIQKLASPQTILETETVAARYTSNSGQTVNTSVSVFTYEDIVEDTHGSYDTATGIYTIPVSGWYIINAQIALAASLSPNQVVQARLHIDGSLNSYVSIHGSGSLSTIEPSINTSIYLTKGQTVGIYGYSAGNVTAYTDGTRNFFSVIRIK